MHDPREDLAWVRQVVEDSRQAMRVDALPLLVWGALTLVGVVLAHLFTALDTVWLWLVLIGMAWLFTAIRALRHSFNQPAGSFAQRALSTLWLGLLTAATLIGFVGVFSGALNPAGITPVVAALFGVGCLGSAVLLDQRAMVLLAIAWWLGSVLLFLLPGPYRLAVFGVLIAALLMVPALRVQRRGRDG